MITIILTLPLHILARNCSFRFPFSVGAILFLGKRVWSWSLRKWSSATSVFFVILQRAPSIKLACNWLQSYLHLPWRANLRQTIQVQRLRVPILKAICAAERNGAGLRDYGFSVRLQHATDYDLCNSLLHDRSGREPINCQLVQLDWAVFFPLIKQGAMTSYDRYTML